MRCTAGLIADTFDPNAEKQIRRLKWLIAEEKKQPRKDWDVALIKSCIREIENLSGFIDRGPRYNYGFQNRLKPRV